MELMLKKKNITNDALLYESQIYNLISQQNDEIKKFFIGFFYSTDTTINELYNQGIIKNKSETILLERMAALDILPDSKIHVIVTEDSKSESLNDYLLKFTNNFVSNDYNIIKKILSNIFDLVIQGIYVLNDILKIQHNDMHFGNILIKQNKMEYSTFDKTHLESEYKISIYDFDRAYYNGHDNELLNNLCATGDGCNNLSLKDMFVFIQSLIFKYLSINTDIRYSLLKKYLEELLQAVVPANYIELLIKNMQDIFNQQKNLHWSSYCMHLDNLNHISLSYPCSNTKDQDIMMSWLVDVPNNFKIFTADIKKESYTYFKKYLKYKNKYLLLKKQH